MHQPYWIFLQRVARPLTTDLVMAAVDQQAVTFPWLQVATHQTLWTELQQELNRSPASVQEDRDGRELTIPRITFIEKPFLGALDCSIEFVHWDAIPVQNINGIPRHGCPNYHIAWMRFLRKVVFARSAINSFICKNSSSRPASKPCESWKTSFSLLRNISSFSTLWIPR